MTALVTGAAGFVGNHVVRLLAERGERIRVLLRPTSQTTLLEGLAVERVSGDLRDRASLDKALDGVRTVYHVAADYRLWARDPREIYESNVQGTRNLLEAARRAKVDRFVYTSTVGTVAVPRGGGPPFGRWARAHRRTLHSWWRKPDAEAGPGDSFAGIGPTRAARTGSAHFSSCGGLCGRGPISTDAARTADSARGRADGTAQHVRQFRKGTGRAGILARSGHHRIRTGGTLVRIERVCAEPASQCYGCCASGLRKLKPGPGKLQYKDEDPGNVRGSKRIRSVAPAA